jgi:hypothetical protein
LLLGGAPADPDPVGPLHLKAVVAGTLMTFALKYDEQRANVVG